MYQKLKRKKERHSCNKKQQQQADTTFKVLTNHDTEGKMPYLLAHQHSFLEKTQNSSQDQKQN